MTLRHIDVIFQQIINRQIFFIAGTIVQKLENNGFTDGSITANKNTGFL